MFPGRAQTQTTRAGGEHTNHKAIAETWEDWEKVWLFQIQMKDQLTFQLKCLDF